MRTRRFSIPLYVLFVLLLSSAWIPQGAPAQETDAAPRPIEFQDIFDWKRISGTQLSDDGRWFAYSLRPGEGNSEVIIRSTSDETEYRFEAGDGGGSGSFSDDGRWFAFTIRPDHQPPGSRRGGGNGTPPRSDMGLVDLTTGEMTKIEGIRSFRFQPETAAWLALSPQPPAAARGSGGGGQGGGERANGSDLILHELATGTRLNVGNVASFAFDDSGRWLAWVVDAAGKVGNGIQLRDMQSGVVRVLESDEARYTDLSWADDELALVALKAVEDEDYEEPLHSLLAWTDVGNSRGATRIEYNPAQDPNFPQGMTISPNRSPNWSEAMDAIYFGIHEVEANAGAREDEAEEGAEEEAGEEAQEERPRGGAEADVPEDLKPELVLWHWKDPRLQAMQQVQERRDESFNYLAVYWTGQDRFVRLADDVVESVSPARVGPWAVGRDNTPYELLDNLDGRNRQNVYAIDMRTGEREMILERARWTNDISPDGTHFLYYQDGDYHTYEFATGEHRNITASVPTSFIDTEDDHNLVDPPVRPRGWTEDGRFVFLSDNWDIWQVGVHGDEGKNLTVNGQAEQIRYQSMQQFDEDNEPGIDLSKPVYFRTYGEWTKKAGYSLMRNGRPGPEVLTFEDRSYGGFMKAEDADTYLISWSTPTEYPNYHVTDARLGEFTQITDGFPEQANFLWTSGARLVDYTSDKGDRLQGALTLPANYQEGQSYPTIVYIYEKRSQGLNSYAFPSANGFNKAVYTSNGYAVFEPDIVYQVNDPGMSAVWCVLPALDAAIETGIVDGDRVGIHGHSWGGYQSAFLVTQTDAFAAVATGAPLTNMISMYASIYWNSGSSNGAIFESSQGRFLGGPWDNLEAYTRNSPVYFAENINTPILLLHNDEDGAVDWNQGIEYYNTIRRLQKPIVMLQYVGENHGLRDSANQKDYTIRMREFFDHFLKGEPAPEWWVDGVPLLEMEDHIKERIDLVKPRSGGGERGRRGGGG